MTLKLNWIVKIKFGESKKHVNQEITINKRVHTLWFNQYETQEQNKRLILI